jgi:hypothetical protein
MALWAALAVLAPAQMLPTELFAGENYKDFTLADDLLPASRFLDNTFDT